MNMNFRQTRRNTLAGASLATILACTNGGSDPKPDPAPTPKLNVVANATIRNLDNPGSDKDYIVGDRVEYRLTANTSLENTTATNTSTVAGGGLDIDGNGDINFTITNTGATILDQSWQTGALNTTQPTTYTMGAKVIVNNQLTSQLQDYLFTFPQNTFTVKPATLEDHTTTQANPIISSNYAWFAQALAPTKDSLGKQYDAATWEKYLRSLQDGVFNPSTGNYEAAKYTLRPETDGVTFVYPDNSSYTVSFTSRAAWYPVYNKLNGK